MKLIALTILVGTTLAGCGLPVPSSRDGRKSPVVTPVPEPLDTNEPEAPSAADGSAYFLAIVKPAVERRCAGCHVNPKGEAGAPATVEIFEYNPMRQWLSNGKSPEQNALMEKAQSIITHGGGNRCPDLNDSPCREFRAWRKIEDQSSQKNK